MQPLIVFSQRSVKLARAILSAKRPLLRNARTYQTAFRDVNFPRRDRETRRVDRPASSQIGTAI
jgi:hypothetical protein